MAIAVWAKRIGDALPSVGRLRRERDTARREVNRLLRMFSEVNRRDGAFLAQRSELRLLLDVSSPIDRLVFGTGEWETAQIGVMTAAARAVANDPRTKLFLDVGAHWGLYALSMWRLGIFDEVHCFEPDPHNFAQLGAQLFLNGASYDIRVHPAAALDAPGRALLRKGVAALDGNRGAAAVRDAGGDTIEVTAVALDDVVLATGAIIFAKLDVEGSEPRTLDGMKRLVAQNDMYLQVEVFPGAEAGLDGRLPENFKLRAIHGWDHIYSTFDLPASQEQPEPATTGASMQ